LGAIKDWSPVLLICGADRAVEELHQLYLHCRYSNDKPRQARLGLIEASLGDPDSFEIARDKSTLLLFAQSIGVRCPKTVVWPLDRFPRPELDAGPVPAILKME